MPVQRPRHILAILLLVWLEVTVVGARSAFALKGDANCDEQVNAADVAAVITTIFGEANTCPTVDVNSDGVVSAADITGVAAAFGPPPPTATPTETPTVTSTPSITPTPTKTGTATRTPTVTRTGTNTRTPTWTRTVTPSGSPTRTPTITATPSITRTPTISPTPSNTRTPTPTRTPTKTATNSATPTQTRTPTATRTATLSPTPSLTRTVTATPTITPTRTVTRTPTPTPMLLPGPQITAFGLADGENFVMAPTSTDDQGNPVYTPFVGAGFFIFVEAKSGSSGSPLGTITINTKSDDPTARPDLQMEANKNLGLGIPAVCDVAGPGAVQTPGGVPGVPTPSFDPQSQPIADALNDIGCRFDLHSNADACTKPNPVTEAPGFVNPNTALQFCTMSAVSTDWKFHSGDTLLTVQWRDMAGNIGNQAHLVVRVP